MKNINITRTCLIILAAFGFAMIGCQPADTGAPAEETGETAGETTEEAPN